MIPERHETSYWTVHIDEETGKAHWVGAGTGDMGETTFDAGEPLIVYPDHFPPSTYISVDEPTDDKGFYDKLFEKRGQKWPRWRPPFSEEANEVFEWIRELVSDPGEYVYASSARDERWRIERKTLCKFLKELGEA
jgi:hypothetical protein